MWRPAERIKYPPQPGPWPDREEAAASLLFSPVWIGSTTLKQRTWVPAMVPWRATEDGFVVETIDVSNGGVGSDFVAGLKRAGQLVGRGASEAWVSSKTAVKGARAQRQSDDDED